VVSVPLRPRFALARLGFRLLVLQKNILRSDGFCPTYWLRMSRMNERPSMTNEQLELGLDGARSETAPRRREGRMARAAWWFAQMRRMVGAAVDWEAAPEPPPEQSWLGLSHRRQSA